MAEPAGRLGVVMKNVNGGGITPAGNVAVSFRATDNRLYEFEFDPGCVGMAALVLLQHLGNAKTSKTVQPMKAISLQGGQFDDGSPMLFLGLEGGGELAFTFSAGNLAELISHLQGIKAPPGKVN